MGYYGGQLPAHDHTATPGDGGVLTNLSVSGTLMCSGLLSAGAGLAITGTGSETVNPSNIQDLSTLGIDAALALLLGA